MRKHYDNYDFGPIRPMTDSPYPAPPAFPKAGEHPRLLFTKDMISSIKATIEKEEYSAVKAALDGFIASEFDGTLGIPYMHETGRKGIHNFDGVGLASIEAKAFAYAIYGDAELGYKAIDAMLTYLITLNIGYIHSDQCREYGLVMHVAAKVYDWCYDLLTEDERHQLIAGVTNYAAAGTCGLPHVTKAAVRKMEVGYPPSDQGCVSGHGSERQVMRDYLSAAIAFYDEAPDWWEYVGGRLYADYIDFRNHYYKCKSAPQGNSLYGPGRQIADFNAAYMTKILFGKTAFIDEMCDTTKTFFSYELPDGRHFSSGDSTHGGYSKAAGSLTTDALFASVIWGDRSLMAQVKYHRPDYTSDFTSTATCTPSEMFILFSHGVEPGEDRHEGYLPVCYNPAPLYQMIARTRWDDVDGAAVYMKGGVRSTANHEHRDAGSFQIFYKGFLTLDSGRYAGYGSEHHAAYHKATISHNSILVYYPELAETEKGWYSGGQRAIPEVKNKEIWLESKAHDIGIAEGAKFALKDDGVSTDYAYIATNIAPAYDTENQVSYISRRMLSVFTDSKEFPLIFATFDRISAVGAHAKKSLLLHTIYEPTLDGKTAITEVEGGRLTATYISDSELELDKIGGEGKTYWINGRQCHVKDKSDGDVWGRVEVSPKLGNLTDDILSLMYVSDAGNESRLEIKEISTPEMLGAIVMNRALIFIRDIDACPTALEIDADGADTLFVSGLSAGKWTATDGKKTETVTVGEDEKFAKFSLGGKITLTLG